MVGASSYFRILISLTSSLCIRVSEFKQRCPVEDGYEDTITWICIGNKLDQAGSPQPNEEVQPVTLQEAQGVLDKIIPSDELAPAASDAGLASGEVTPMPVENNPASNPSASEVQSEGTMNGIAQSAQNIHLPNTNNVPFPSVNGPKGLTNGLPSSIDIERTKAKLKNKSSRSTIARSRERESSKASVYHTPAGSISGSGWTQHLAQQQLYQSNGPSSLGSSTHTLTLASPPRFGTAYLPEDSEEPRSAGTSQTPSQVNGKLELPPLTPPVDSMSDTSTVHANGQSEAALEAELTNGVIQASTPCEVAQEGNEEGEDDMVEAPPWHGIRLFYASAKSGLGVEEAFDYVARHIYERLQYDERQRQNSHNDQSKGPFGLSNVQLGNKDQSGAVHVDRNGAREGKGWKSACCG